MLWLWCLVIEKKITFSVTYLPARKDSCLRLFVFGHRVGIEPKTIGIWGRVTTYQMRHRTSKYYWTHQVAFKFISTWALSLKSTGFKYNNGFSIGTYIFFVFPRGNIHGFLLVTCRGQDDAWDSNLNQNLWVVYLSVIAAGYPTAGTAPYR